MLLDHLNDIEVFIEMVENLARSHVKRKLNVEHFENLKGSLVRTFVSLLGDSVMTPETIGAWAKAYSVITGIVQKHIDNVAE